MSDTSAADKMSSLSANYDYHDIRSQETLNNISNVSDVSSSGSSHNLSFDWMCFPDLDRLSHCIVVFILALLGVVGNVSLLLVIVFSKHLHSAPNILIVNLILGDLLYILATAPFNIRHEIYVCWLLGSAACKIKHYLPIVAQAACVFSLVALSRDRYNAIVKGLESRVKHRSIDSPALTVSVSWILGCIIGTPVFYFTEVRTFGLLCQFMPMGEDIKCKLYMLTLFCILYIIPFFIMTYHYVQLARSLVHSSILSLMENSTSIQQLRSRRRLALIVIIITVFFGVFWLPYYVYHIWYIFTRYGRHIKLNTRQVQIFRHFYNYVALLNSCINPWIVFFMSSAHRTGICNIICGGKTTEKVIARKTIALRWRSTCVQTSPSTSRNSHSSTAYPPTILSDHVGRSAL